MLSLVLQRLYSLQAQPEAPRVPDASNRPPEGWEKLDELLSMLLSLHEHGVSHSGSVSREDFGAAVLECACRLMKSTRGSMMLFDEKAGVLKLVAAKGFAGHFDEDAFELWFRGWLHAGTDSDQRSPRRQTKAG